MPVQGPGLLSRSVLTMDVQQVQHSTYSVQSTRTSLLHNAIINLDMSICRYLRTFHTHIDISGDFPLKFHPSSIVYALSHKSISADNRI